MTTGDELIEQLKNEIAGLEDSLDAMAQKNRGSLNLERKLADLHIRLRQARQGQTKEEETE